MNSFFFRFFPFFLNILLISRNFLIHINFLLSPSTPIFLFHYLSFLFPLILSFPSSYLILSPNLSHCYYIIILYPFILFLSDYSHLHLPSISLHSKNNTIFTWRNFRVSSIFFHFISIPRYCSSSDSYFRYLLIFFYIHVLPNSAHVTK